MSVEAMIVAALTGFGYDVANSVSYSKNKTYFAFHDTVIPADYGDDTPQHERHLVQVHFFCPLNVNITTMKTSIRRALYAAGFSWASVTDASDGDGRHIVFECETADGVNTDGDDDDGRTG